MRDSKREIRLHHCFDMATYFLDKMNGAIDKDMKEYNRCCKNFRVWRRKYTKLMRDVEYRGKR